VAGDGVREGPEISRRIRDELERIRDAEGRVEEALEAVRQARRRVEVIARELAREEERVRAWVREEIKAAGGLQGPGAPRPADPADEAAVGDAGARSWRSEPPLGWSTWKEPPASPREPAASGTPRPSVAAAPPSSSTPAAQPALAAGPAMEARRPAAPEVDAVATRPAAVAPAAIAAPSTAPTPSPAPDRSVWWTRAGLGAAAAVAVALVGWFAIRGLRQEAAEAPPVTTAPASASAPAPVTVEPPRVAQVPAADSSPLALLPTDPTARQALYDSLFTARASFFDPLLAQVETETSDRAVQRALTAWKEGPIDAQDADLIHSALLQHVLKAEIDPRIEIDGQVLRTPCRGRSCTALLSAWEQRRDQYGLPAVPANAATDPRALRQAEAALVLGWLRTANVGATTGATTTP
jgi:hypothetical protein